MAPARRQTTDARDVEAYIAAAPAGAQPHLRQLRAAIRAAAPKAEEKISYGMPYYSYAGRLVYFGVHASHIGFYPAGYAAKYPQLKEYIAGPGTIRFPLDRPLPIEQIKKLVAARVKENDANAKAKAKPRPKGGSARP